MIFHIYVHERKTTAVLPVGKDFKNDIIIVGNDILCLRCLGLRNFLPAYIQFIGLIYRYAAGLIGGGRQYFQCKTDRGSILHLRILQTFLRPDGLLIGRTSGFHRPGRISSVLRRTHHIVDRHVKELNLNLIVRTIFHMNGPGTSVGSILLFTADGDGKVIIFVYLLTVKGCSGYLHPYGFRFSGL